MFSVWRISLLAKMLSDAGFGGKKGGKKGQREGRESLGAQGVATGRPGCLWHVCGCLWEDIGGWSWSLAGPTPEVTKSSRWADFSAVPVIYTQRGSSPGHTRDALLCCRTATSGGVAVMDPTQTRCAQQPWCSSFPPQEQTPSLPALSHKQCFVGNAAGNNE